MIGHQAILQQTEGVKMVRMLSTALLTSLTNYTCSMETCESLTEMDRLCHSRKDSTSPTTFRARSATTARIVAHVLALTLSMEGGSFPTQSFLLTLSGFLVTTRVRLRWQWKLQKPRRTALFPTSSCPPSTTRLSTRLETTQRSCGPRRSSRRSRCTTKNSRRRRWKAGGSFQAAQMSQ